MVRLTDSATSKVVPPAARAAEASMPRRFLGPALLLAAASCGDPSPTTAPTPAPPADAAWPFYRQDPGLRGGAPTSIGDRFELAWSFATQGPIVSSPVVQDGLAYIGSNDGKVYAVELATGRERWAFATEDAIDAPPLLHDGRVYIGSCDFNFYALDARTGDLVWQRPTDDKVLGGANHVRTADGTSRILVGSYDTRLYCFAAVTGEQLWTYTTDNYVNGTPAILDDRVVFGGCDCVLHVVSATTGAGLAKVPLGDGCHVAGSVALADGAAYFGHYGCEFVCVDLASGEFRWSYPGDGQPFFSSPAVGAEHVLFGGRDKRLHCVRRRDGEPLWTFPTGRKVDAAPVLCGDRVVFASADGRLYVATLAAGRELWRYEIGRPILSSPAVAGGWILVGCNDGNLYAFRPAA